MCFIFYMYIYATNSKCQSLTVPYHTARCYVMKIGIWIHFKRKNDSNKEEIFALPYGRYVFMMRKSGDYFTIFIFVFVMVMYNISMLVLYLVLLFTGPNFGTDCIRLYFSINLQCDLTYTHIIFIQNTILLSILSNLFDVFQAKILLKFN